MPIEESSFEIQYSMSPFILRTATMRNNMKVSILTSYLKYYPICIRQIFRCFQIIDTIWSIHLDMTIKIYENIRVIPFTFSYTIAPNNGDHYFKRQSEFSYINFWVEFLICHGSSFLSIGQLLGGYVQRYLLFLWQGFSERLIALLIEKEYSVPCTHYTYI